MSDVRRLTLADLPAYRALHRHGLNEAAHAFVESLDEDAARPDSAVSPVIARGEAWGAFSDGKLVGKMTIDRIDYATFAHTRWIHGFYMSAEARGTGLAKKLLQTAMDDARAAGVTHFLLWVNAENDAARRFYSKLGFRDCGRVPGGIVANGRAIDDMLMCLETAP